MPPDSRFRGNADRIGILKYAIPTQEKGDRVAAPSHSVGSGEVRGAGYPSLQPGSQAAASRAALTSHGSLIA